MLTKVATNKGLLIKTCSLVQTIYLPSGMELDIMSFMKGLTQDKFDECYSLAAETTIHEVPVKFLHLHHLIAAKKASARPQDLQDIAELEKIYGMK